MWIKCSAGKNTLLEIDSVTLNNNSLVFNTPSRQCISREVQDLEKLADCFAVITQKIKQNEKFFDLDYYLENGEEEE